MCNCLSSTWLGLVCKIKQNINRIVQTLAQINLAELYSDQI